MAGKARRTATSIPPALTFRAVANSRNSFPWPSRLWTKTGMASGNLVHFRRSPTGLVMFMQRTLPEPVGQVDLSSLVANFRLRNNESPTNGCS